MKQAVLSLFLCGLALLGLFGCAQERIVTGAHHLSFSVDTLRLDTLYTRISSSTSRLIVYNTSSEQMLLEHVALVQSSNFFRANVDGRAGAQFSDILIPAKDSIFVFVEATFPEGASDLPEEEIATLRFQSGSLVDTIRIEAWRMNTDHATALQIEQDTLFTGGRPLYLCDSLVVKEGVTLRMAAGTHILMANSAHIEVHGRIEALGTPGNPIMIEGVRRDNLVKDVNYRLIPGQWEALRFYPSSRDNLMQNTIVRNGRGGVIVEGATIRLEGCQITNMKGGAVSVVRGGKAALVNCELSNTLSHSLRLEGASCNMCYTTICNWYPFDLRQGEAVSIVADSTGKESELHAEASVVDGSMANEVHCDEASLMRFNQCYIRAKGLGEGSIEAKLAADSTYTHVGRDLEKNEYDFIYDYRPLPKAPFVARPTTDQTPLHDRFGVPRTASAAWGAYEPSEAKEHKRNMR